MAITNMLVKSDKNPVGMIVASMLTLAQFQALNGTTWVLADGGSCTGTLYATVTGNTTLPDARGLVLRGKNNSRADGNQDPAGERALGNFQTHTTAKNGLALSDPSHSHSVNDPGHSHIQTVFQAASNGGNIPIGFANVGANVSGAYATYGATTGVSINGAATGITLGAGDAETRMRNLAVNHFIKVDN